MAKKLKRVVLAIGDIGWDEEGVTVYMMRAMTVLKVRPKNGWPKGLSSRVRLVAEVLE